VCLSGEKLILRLCPIYLLGRRTVGVFVDMRDGNIKVELEEIACATVVWTEINVIK
jgi:hypothetical protein